MKDKIALITGSTSGIGKATAQKLLDQGVTVIVAAIQEELDVASEFTNSSKAVYRKVDISSKREIESARDWVEKEYGRLDYLVANAGVIPLPCGIDDITEENIDKTINVNLKGTFWSLKILGKLIQDTSKDGAIVAMSSVDGLIGEPHAVIYSATKAAIISMVRSFARHYADPLVRVNAVAPGLINTPLTASAGEDPSLTTDVSIIQRMGQPEEIAEAVSFLLSDSARFITGQVLPVDGGFTLK